MQEERDVEEERLAEFIGLLLQNEEGFEISLSIRLLNELRETRDLIFSIILLNVVAKTLLTTTISEPTFIISFWDREILYS